MSIAGRKSLKSPKYVGKLGTPRIKKAGAGQEGSVILSPTRSSLEIDNDGYLQVKCAASGSTVGQISITSTGAVGAQRATQTVLGTVKGYSTTDNNYNIEIDSSGRIKLRQLSNQEAIESTATLSDLITAFNNLITNLKSKCIMEHDI